MRKRQKRGCGVEIEGQFNSIHEILVLLSCIMAHLVTISTAIPSQSSSSSAIPSQSSSSSPSSGIGSVVRSQQSVSVSRRDVGLRLFGFGFGFGLIGSNNIKSAEAAARRPPPTPPTEKKDPNVSGVLAKVIASKKRKEAMKESMAQLREKGKLINPE